MPGTKEIRAKISSVKSTQKITKAMQMVATSKMRRAQERMKLARPYAKRMLEVIGHLTEANPDYRHPFLMTREPKAVGIVVVSTDRGLAGALGGFRFDFAHGFFQRQPLAGDLGFGKRRLNTAELGNQRGTGPLIERTTAFAGGTGIQSGDGASDQRVVIGHINSTVRALQ